MKNKFSFVTNMSSLFVAGTVSLLFVLSASLFSSCNSSNPDEEGLDAFNDARYIQMVKDISADSFEGRKPFTSGEEKTVAYLKEKFSSVGLDPGNGSSYFQDVPLASILANADSQMTVTGRNRKIILTAPHDYIVWTDRTEPAQSFDASELVFAGYGVVAPEHGWNDYEGLDVKGKIVMVLVNDPGFNSGDTSLFKGKTMTYYGRWTYKFEEAARQGAKGCLVIHETKAAGYPFAVLQSDFNTSRLQLDERGKDAANCEIIGWITDEIAKTVITAAGMDASATIASADKKGFKAIPLSMHASTKMTVQAEYNVSKNVIGQIKGSKYPDETIIYTAHWDHLGVGPADETGDSIYNGAFDNATGVAGLVEIAHAFTSLKTPPERTIVFLAVTAEEQGLLGSAYYAQNPVFPLAKTVANINMDGVNYLGKTKDVIPVGKGQSELEDIVEMEAARQGRYMGQEDHPEAGYYYRSDHFNFAKAGVPSLHFDNGLDMETMDREAVGRAKDEYREKHYHRPSDEYSDDWDVSGAMQDLQLYFMLGKKLATNRFWPQWKEGSEFREIREKSQRER